MSTFPPLEARVSALERQQTISNARVEEVYSDMLASFRQLAKYTETIEDRFDKIDEDMTEIKATMATKAELAEIKATMATMATKAELAEIRATMATKVELAEIRATMATKNELAAMENRILDAFKQLVVIVKPQQPPLQ